MISSPPAALLSELRRQRVSVSLRNSRLVVQAPPGVATPQMRETLAEHKPEILAHLPRMEPFHNMSLEEFARSGSALEVRIPTCRQTHFWVAGRREVQIVMQRGVGRGRIWTIEELLRVWRLPGRTLDQAQTLARVREQLDCELEAIEPLSDSGAPPAGRGPA